MPMNIDELHARQAEIKSRMEEIDVEHKDMVLPAEPQDEYDRCQEEFLTNEKTINHLELRKAQIEELASNPENREHEQSAHLQTRRSGVARGDDIWDLETIRTSASSPQAMTRELQERGKRAIEGMSPAHEEANREDVQAHLERLQTKLDGKTGEFSRHLLTTGSPAYRRAFVSAIAGQYLSADEQRAITLTGENGGFLLPYQLDPTVIPTSNGAVNPLRAISRVEQTTQNLWKGVTSGGITAKYREAEAEETTDDSPKFVQPEVEAHAADAFAQWTYEFGQDYGSIAPELAAMVQTAKDELEATKLLSGSGTKEPFGLATGATELVETVGSVAFAVADVYALEQALPPRFRPRGSWVANRAYYNRIRQFDTAGGASLWVQLAEGLSNTPNGNVGQRLLDYSTNELSSMESALMKLKTAIFFGDFRYFLIADRIGTIAKPIPDVPGPEGRPSGQSGLYFFWRTGAKVLSKAAFRGLKIKE